MSGEWFAAWAVATVVALVVTPFLARSGRSRRGTRRRRAALATAAGPLLAVLATLPFVVPELDVELAVALAAALVLWYVGQLLERGLIAPVFRKIAVGVAATAVVAAGLRIELVGVTWADAVLTVVIIWGATSAWRSAETRDGLLLGWTIVVAGGAGLLGGLASDAGVAVLAAAAVGASTGFLPYVLPPVAARLRRGGALLLGFLSVTLALATAPSSSGLRATTAQLLLIAIPLLEGAVGAAARRRGRGNDPRSLGLVARWRALGLPRLATTLTLVMLQGALSITAVFVGRGVVRVEVGAAAAAIVLVVALLPAMLARLGAPTGRWPRWALAAALVVVGGMFLLAAPAAIAMVRARSDTAEGAKAAERALAAARRGEPERSERAFREAEQRFVAAQKKLEATGVTLGVTVPFLGPNLDAAREIVDVGVDLARAGRRLTTTADPDQLRIVDATVNLEEMARLRPQFESTAELLTEAEERIDDIETTFLIAPIEEAVQKLDRRIDRAARDSRTAAISSRILPSILGGDEPRRYFLAMQNNAESRAAGGFIGNYAELTAVDGKVELGEVEPIRTLNPGEREPRTLEAPEEYVRRYARFSPERFWQNVNVSPDVPTVGAVEASLLSQGPFGPVDGVVTIDPKGLASVLEITGPISVPGWPERITAENVVRTTLHDAYVYFEGDNERREEFLGDVADAAWDAFSDRDLGSPANVVKHLAKATRDDHLTLWFADHRAERLAVRAGADGTVPRSPSDLVLVTTGNTAENKIDFYLHRTLDYDLELVPQADESQLGARGTLGVALRNEAPAEGIPSYVIGSNRPDYAAGENGSFLSVYTPLDLERATLDGEKVAMEHERELGREVYSRFVRIPSQSTRTLDLDLQGALRLTGDGWYELAVQTQPTINPDEATVRLRLPAGWRFGATDGGLEVGADGRTATFQGTLDRDVLLRTRVVPSRGDGIWAHLRDGRPL